MAPETTGKSDSIVNTQLDFQLFPDVKNTWAGTNFDIMTN